MIALLTLLVAAGLGAAALIVVPNLTDEGSSSAKPSGITVPSLVGQPLDVAERRLDDLGLRASEEGGGIFGVLLPSDWEVCQTSPPADSTVRPGTTVRLLIDRPGAC
ncbi:MAG: PASTA domain-containing protein [Solirubrobacterales bacterium]